MKKEPKTFSQFGGVLPSNRLPTHQFRHPQFFIINTDPHNKPAKH